MKPETVAQIAKHPMVIGIKDATGEYSTGNVM
jgi:dihydrodipicolinate synthase/N-acetylneuraminate lyase